MARKVFYSFHYKPDNWRASQVRSIGAVEGNQAATDNNWESVTRGGDDAIKRWISAQLYGRTCSIVLIGAATAGRKWIKYEIEKTWKDGKGLLGIHIHRLLNKDGIQSAKGSSPFDGYTIKQGASKLSSIVHAYDPPFGDSKDAYNYIRWNLSQWIEEAVQIRNDHQ